METTNLNGESYVLIPFLKKYGVKKQTIYNGLSRNRRKRSKYYEHYADPVDNRIKWIKYTSLPNLIFMRYNLPSPDKIADMYSSEINDRTDDLIIRTLQFAYEIEYKSFQKLYYGTFYERSLIESYSKTHSLFVSILKLKQAGISIQKTYPVYSNFSNLQFTSKSLTSFYAKLKSFEKYGHRALIHRSYGLTKDGTKVTEAHKKQVIKLYKDPKQFSGREIHQKLNNWAVREGYSLISLSSVKKMICDPYIQNQCKPFRNGIEWETLMFGHYIQRLEPKENGSLWQLDGSRLQIPYLSGDSKVKFLTIFVVMDIHSRKIIGYSSDTSENHKMVIQALKMAVKTTRYLPLELVIDNGSCFKHEDFRYIEEHMGFLGTNVRRHKVGSPRDKGHVERFFSTFQTTICKHVDGYIGEGIKSRREEGRPSRKLLQEAMSLKNIRSKIQLEKLLADLIHQYNELQIHESKPSPNVNFQMARTNKNVGYVSENEFALMFWNKTRIQVKNSMILLSEGSLRDKRFQYLIEDSELRLSLNLTTVKVCYQREDRSIIKLFDENQQWIADLKKSTPINPVIKRKVDNQIRPLHSFDSIEEDKKQSKSKKNTKNENQLFKQPASFDVLLIKSKNNE